MSNLLRDVRLSGERLIDGADDAPSAALLPVFAAERKAGFDAGFAEGRKAGRDDAAKELDAALLALEDAATRVAAARDEALSAGEADVADLALLIAEKIVKTRSESDPELAVEMVREAIRRISDRSRLQIRVHPDSLAPVAAHRAEWLTAMGGPGLLEVVPDRRVSPGGAEIVFPEGIVDARLETQLSEARRLFVERQNEAASRRIAGGNE